MLHVRPTGGFNFRRVDVLKLVLLAAPAVRLAGAAVSPEQDVAPPAFPVGRLLRPPGRPGQPPGNWGSLPPPPGSLAQPPGRLPGAWPGLPGGENSLPGPPGRLLNWTTTRINFYTKTIEPLSSKTKDGKAEGYTHAYWDKVLYASGLDNKQIIKETVFVPTVDDIVQKLQEKKCEPRQPDGSPTGVLCVGGAAISILPKREKKVVRKICQGLSPLHTLHLSMPA